MSVQTQTFTPELLNSYSQLQQFFIGKHVQEKTEKQLLAASQQWQTNWMGRWNIVPLLVIDPFLAVYAVFLKTIGFLLYSLDVNPLGLRLDLEGDIAMGSNRIIGYCNFGEDFLASSCNIYSPEAAELYGQPEIKKTDIGSSSVQDVIEREIVKFDENGGCCRGSSLWFIRTYLKTQKLFADHRTHLQALGSLFSNGAPLEAALFHKLCASEEVLNIIGDSARPDYEIENPNPGYQTGDDEAAYANLITAFKRLPAGAYYVHVPCHGMAYISIGNGQGYFYDPNLGTAAIHDESTFRELASQICYYQVYKEKLFKRLREVDPTYEGDNNLVAITRMRISS